MTRFFLFISFIFALSSAPDALAETKLTLKQAVAQVQRESGGKVLSARTIKTSQGDAYRIKVLTRAGRVKVLQIPETVTKDQ